MPICEYIAAIETADADLSAALVREGIRLIGPLWLSTIGDDRVVMGLPDRILTLDAASGEILTTTGLKADAGSADDLARELTFRRFDGGFSALVQYYRDPVYQTMLYLYDERSALTRTVPLREFFAIQPDHLAIQCALSASGKKVACTDPLSSAILIRELDSDAAVERIDVGAQTGLSMNYSNHRSNFSNSEWRFARRIRNCQLLRNSVSEPLREILTLRANAQRKLLRGRSPVQ